MVSGASSHSCLPLPLASVRYRCSSPYTASPATTRPGRSGHRSAAPQSPRQPRRRAVWNHRPPFAAANGLGSGAPTEESSLPRRVSPVSMTPSPGGDILPAGLRWLTTVPTAQADASRSPGSDWPWPRASTAEAGDRLVGTGLAERGNEQPGSRFDGNSSWSSSAACDWPLAYCQFHLECRGRKNSVAGGQREVVFAGRSSRWRAGYHPCGLV
jgi:hypothetical protein